MKLPKKEVVNTEAALTTAKQIAEHKRIAGETPRQIFIENNGFLFREPNWTDVEHLIYVRLLNQDTLLDEQPIIIEETKEDL